MNSKLKVLGIIILLIIFSGCGGNKIKRRSDKRYIYGVIKDGEISRMGIPREKLKGVDYYMRKEYSTYFSGPRKLHSQNTNDVQNSYAYVYIKFYNDIIMIINEKEFIISQEEIIEMKTGDEIWYYFVPKDPSFKLFYDKYHTYILDIGEIEIIDKYGKTIQPKRSIPPLVFKRIETVGITRTKAPGEVIDEIWYEDKKIGEKEREREYKKVLNEFKNTEHLYTIDNVIYRRSFRIQRSSEEDE